MISPAERSRLILVQQACVLFLIEGLIKTLFGKFPFVELVAAQVSILGGYLAVKTISNVDRAKYEKRNIVGD